MHDLGVFGERLQLARHPVVEPHAERQQQIAVADRPVRVHAAVHSEHVERQRIVGRERAQPHQSHRHRDARNADEFPQFLARVGRNHPTATVDQRPLGHLDRCDHLVDLLRLGVRRHRVPVARQVHRHIPIGLDLLQLDVFRQIDQHRPRTPRCRDVEGFLHHARQIGYVRHQVVMLRNAAAHLDNRRLLERIRADGSRGDLPRNRDNRDAVQLGVRQTGHEVRRARPAGRHADARPSGGTRVTLRRKRAPLFVAGKNRADLVRKAGQCLVQRHTRTTRIGEKHFDTVSYQRLDQNISATHQLMLGRLFRRGHSMSP